MIADILTKGAPWKTESDIELEEFHLVCIKDWCAEDTYDRQVKH